MGKEMIFFRDSCTRVRDLEKENKELVKQSSIDKRTLVTLREVRSRARQPAGGGRGAAGSVHWLGPLARSAEPI